MANRTVLLVGGAPYLEPDVIALAPRVDRLVAVDGGANRLPKNFVPDAIVGDLDSLIRDTNVVNEDQIFSLSDQNLTDLEKAVAFVAAEKILGVGFIGARFDQTLTVLHCLSRFPEQQFFFVAEDDVMITLPKGSFSMSLPKGSRVSLYPVLPTTFSASTGLLYPLENLHLEQGKTIGTSNQTTSDQFSVTANSLGCLLLLDRKHRNRLVDAFLTA